MYEHYLYEHTHAHPISISTSERLSRFDLEIYKIGHQELLAVDGMPPLTERRISRKYNTHIKSRI
jgi:hypothetical protein